MQFDLAAEIYKNFVDNDIDALVMPGFSIPSPKLGRASVIFLI